MIALLGSLRRLAVVSGVAAALVGSASQSNAATGILFNFDTVFSTTPPAGSAPWVSARFEDATPGAVRVTISAINLLPSQEVADLYLNLNPNFNPLSLHFSDVTTSPGLLTPQVSLGADAFSGGTSGRYDMRFLFSETARTAFTSGDSISALVTGVAGLRATDFGFQSTAGGQTGPFYGAIHILDRVSTLAPLEKWAPDQGTWVGVKDVTSLTVPEPGVMALAALALVLGRNRFLKAR